MVEADEVKMQLRAECRPEAEASEKKAQILKAIEVTERQLELIGEKATAIVDMQAKLEERLSTFHGWLTDLEASSKSTAKAKV